MVQVSGVSEVVLLPPESLHVEPGAFVQDAVEGAGLRVFAVPPEGGGNPGIVGQGIPVPVAVVDLRGLSDGPRGTRGRGVKSRYVEQGAGARRSVEVVDAPFQLRAVLLQYGLLDPFGRYGKAVGALIHVGEIGYELDIVHAQGMVEPVGFVAVPPLVERALVRSHGPQPDFPETERTAHQFPNGPVDGGMADQSVEGRRGNERVIVGLLVMAVRMPEIGEPAAVFIEEIAKMIHFLVREDLAQVDESVLTKERLVCLLHGNPSGEYLRSESRFFHLPAYFQLPWFFTTAPVLPAPGSSESRFFQPPLVLPIAPVISSFLRCLKWRRKSPSLTPTA